jgi:hypothetical protein
LVERAAFNESQKTFQQMSQKDALQLAKDVYEFDLKTTYGGYARWVAPAIPKPITAPANILPKVVILNILLGVTFPNVVVVSLIVTRVIGLLRLIGWLVRRTTPTAGLSMVFMSNVMTHYLQILDLKLRKTRQIMIHFSTL